MSGHLEAAAKAVASILASEDPESEFIVTISERKRGSEVAQSAGRVDAGPVLDGDFGSGLPDDDAGKKAA